MKNVASIILLLLCASVSVAQDKQPAEENNSRQKISKGYYSIGDHAKKLPAENSLRFLKTSVEREQARKGFYAIESKPQTKVTYHLPNNAERPKKGYYSIGAGNQ